MAEPKTRATNASVAAFLDGIADEQRRADSKAVAKLMQRLTGAKPKLWGTNIVGFGSYRHVYASGRAGDWPLAAFSPRAQALTLYLMPGFADRDPLMAKLGTFKTGKSCLYVKRLADVDLTVLEKLVAKSVDAVRKKHPVS
jgi:hypothetical protein